MEKKLFLVAAMLLAGPICFGALYLYPTGAGSLALVPGGEATVVPSDSSMLINFCVDQSLWLPGLSISTDMLIPIDLSYISQFPVFVVRPGWEILELTRLILTFPADGSLNPAEDILPYVDNDVDILFKAREYGYSLVLDSIENYPTIGSSMVVVYMYPAPIPEPAALSLLTLGAAVMLRKKK